MVVLIDLDGTLTDTAHEQFKPFKDGLKDFEISEIPVFQGAIQFVQNLNRNHRVIIVSDSHPKYVNKIASEIFGLEIINSNISDGLEGTASQVVYLADKPNSERILELLDYYVTKWDPYFPDIRHINEMDEFLMIGDSWLDIELGRRLNIRTVLTKFYKATSVEIRDGIGDDLKPLKMGATYYAKTFEEINLIIENPNKQLLALEAVFQYESSENMVRFLEKHSNGNFIAFRCLARQEDGECDRFARADMYYQIDNVERTKEFLSMLAQSITNYLKRVERYPEYHWDYLTYVSDKKTTNPPNKMKEIFDLIEISYPKIKLFEWSDDVVGSLRNQPNYHTRREFIAKYLKTIENIELNGKSVIVIDDQFTSSATAFEISHQLRHKGVKNILFVALFYLILPVESKNCPSCGKPLKIKINKTKGTKFYSCVPPKFKGSGCGYLENI